MAPRAVWHFALYGTSRSLAVRALWQFAPYGTSRILAARIYHDSSNPYCANERPHYLPLSFRGGGTVLDPGGGVVRGTLDVLILKALSWGPRHGYAVAEWIASATERELLVEEGPLYTALHRLEKKGWLLGEWGLSDNNRRAKYYALTTSGRRQLRAEVSSWERYARAVSRALAVTAASPA